MGARLTLASDRAFKHRAIGALLPFVLHGLPGAQHGIASAIAYAHWREQLSPMGYTQADIASLLSSGEDLQRSLFALRCFVASERAKHKQTPDALTQEPQSGLFGRCLSELLLTVGFFREREAAQNRALGSFHFTL